MSAGWNPRFVAYCRSQKRDPLAQISHDYAVWPGGSMCGFILWIGQRLNEFYREHREAFIDRNTLHDQAAFDSWLNARFP